MSVKASAPSASNRFLESISSDITAWTGSTSGFVLAVVVVLVWAVSGPFFGFSETWQLVINTGTTIITFLMVFLIQNTQNRDGAAMQAKLDEILLATKESRDEFVGIENLSEEDLVEILSACQEEAAAQRQDPTFKEKLKKMHDVLKGSRAA